jgi:hypothetical protein
MIAEGAPRYTLTGLPDAAPPVLTEFRVFDDPANPGRKLLGFTAADAESGVAETRLRGRRYLRWSDWVTAQNPVALMGNIWAVEIQVRDNAGNATSRVIYQWSAFLRNFSPIFALSATLLAAFWFYRRRKRLSSLTP